jgi:hypothetical protein
MAHKDDLGRKERLRVNSRRYYRKHKNALKALARQRVKKTKHYLGTDLCPKCGKKAHICLMKQKYLPTGNDYGWGLYCSHTQWIEGKMLSIGDCWIPLTAEEYEEKVGKLAELKVQTPLQASIQDLTTVNQRIANLLNFRKELEARIKALSEESCHDATWS